MREGITLKRLGKADYINIFILLLVYLAVILIITRFTKAYGSTLDWQAQHWVIPEYFRTLFYDTHDFFPGFAFNLGAGQNIYYFSYYGLLSPVILFSYLLPWVPMADYMMSASILCVAVSVVMLYLRMRREYTPKISFISSFLFLCSGALIFHSHRHIMFVIYMPFLLLALNGVDRLIEKNKSLLLTLSVLLIILSSYFFSVGAIACAAIYTVYRFLKNNGEFSPKCFTALVLRFMSAVVIAVMLSAVLLLPTLYTLISGRDDANITLHPSQLLVPSVNLDFMIYSPYSLGLTAVFLFAVFTAVTGRRRHCFFLALCFLLICVIPGIVYLFNGTLYIDAKVLIPFLPLAAILLAEFFAYISTEGFKKRIIIPVVIFSAAGILAYKADNSFLLWAYFGEIFVYTAALCLKNKVLGRRLFVATLMIFSFFCTAAVNLQDDLVTLDSFRSRLRDSREDLVSRVTQSEDTVVRISDHRFTMEDVNRICGARHYTSTIYSSLYNKRYNKFFHSVMKNENPYRNSAIISQSRSVIFDILMGAEYLISDSPASVGYALIGKSGKLNLYQNAAAFPVAFSSSKTLSREAFERLDYPYTAEALLKYIITENGGSEFSSDIEKMDGDLLSLLPPQHMIKRDGETLVVKSGADFELTAKLPEMADGKILFICFDVDNTFAGKDKDTYIKINRMQNKLTCKSWKYYNGNTRFCYALSSAESFGELEMLFSQGEYKLSNISVYVLDYSVIASLRSELDAMDFDMERTKGDVISGSISCAEDGWFMLTVPYDAGFSVLVDGESQNYEMVDGAFIGFPIEKGDHQIEITFTPPLLPQGKIISFFGLIMLAVLAVYEKADWVKKLPCRWLLILKGKG